MERPSLDRSWAEQGCAVVGGLSLVAGIAMAAIAVTSYMGGGDVVYLGLLAPGLILIVAAPGAFGLAEILARLRRQEERDLVDRWEADREASAGEEAARRAARR